MGTNFTLAQVVSQLRSELEAINRAARDRPLFTVDSCEIELGVTVTGGGSAGVSLGFFELGGQRTKANSTTVRLTLTPLGIVAAALDDEDIEEVE